MSLWHVPDGKCLWERLVTVPAVHTAALPFRATHAGGPIHTGTSLDRRSASPSTPEMWQCHADRPDDLTTETTPHGGMEAALGAPSSTPVWGRARGLPLSLAPLLRDETQAPRRLTARREGCVP